MRAAEFEIGCGNSELIMRPSARLCLDHVRRERKNRFTDEPFLIATITGFRSADMNGPMQA
jgi:hypothetical protein